LLPSIATLDVVSRPICRHSSINSAQTRLIAEPLSWRKWKRHRKLYVRSGDPAQDHGRVGGGFLVSPILAFNAGRQPGKYAG
jgi:hypothetical protein